MNKSLVLFVLLIISILGLINTETVPDPMFYFKNERVLVNTSNLVNPMEYKQVQTAIAQNNNGLEASTLLFNAVTIGLAFLPSPWATATTLGAGFVWGKLFPGPSIFLNDQKFASHLQNMLGDMADKISLALQEAEKREAEIWATSTYESIRNAGNSFRDIETLYMAVKKGDNNILSGLLNPLLKIDSVDMVQIYMLIQHGVYKSMLETALTFMSHQDKVVYYMQVYIQTLTIYSSLIRDSIFYGEEWGLPIQLVYGSTDLNIESYKENLHKRIMSIIGIYMEQRKTIINSSHQRDFLDSLVSSLFYSDLLLYPFYHGWLERSFTSNVYEIPSTKKSTYTIDPTIHDLGNPNPKYPYQTPILGRSSGYTYSYSYAKENQLEDVILLSPTNALGLVTSYTITIRAWIAKTETGNPDPVSPITVQFEIDEANTKAALGANNVLSLEYSLKPTPIPFQSKIFLENQDIWQIGYSQVIITAPIKVTMKYVKFSLFVDAIQESGGEEFFIDHQVLAVDIIINDDTGKQVTATNIPN